MAGSIAISALPSGTAPTGVELIPVVQSANTVKLTVDQILSLITLAGLGGVTAAEVSTQITDTVTAGFIGETVYAQTAAEVAAGVTPTSYAYAPGDIRRYGALTTASNNTTAFTQALAQAKAGGNDIYIPQGNFIGQFNFTGTTTGIRIYGASLSGSIITAVSTTSDVITFAPGGQYWGLTFQNFAIKGAPGSTAGNGIHFPTGLGFIPFNITMQQLYIYGFGQSGIYDQIGINSSILSGVFIDQCAGHLFDLFGDNTLQLQGCYAGATTGSGTAGYRIHSGFPVMIACNGVNAGDYWGIFSDTASYCLPDLIGCNVESFNVVGCYNLQCGLNVDSATTFAASIANSIAVKLVINNTSLKGNLANDDSFLLEGAGSWLNGYPVHTANVSVPPFVTVFSPQGTSQFTWWDEVTAATAAMTTVQSGNIAPARAAFKVFDLYVTGLIRRAYSGTAALASGTALITLSPILPTTSYTIKLSGNANETFYWTAKATGGFTINSSNVASTASVDWSVEMT